MPIKPTRFFNRSRRWGLLCGLTLAVAQLFTPAGLGTAHAATTNCTPNVLTQTCTVTFAYSGAAETWTVPEGVTQATFDLSGAQGGNAPGGAGGQGGRVTATLGVTPGATYQILAGGQNGFNGGGAGAQSGRNGGGASDVRSGVFALADRLLVAGGGGGSGSSVFSDGFVGGSGGYPSGGTGVNSSQGGRGGTQTAGGSGGNSGILGNSGNSGGLGQGGPSRSDGGAGGGGYYGGGSGGTGGPYGGAGGGGSSYGPNGATFENGVRTGDGLVIISYDQTDTTAPVANPTQSPAANASGWTTSRNVTVNWNWTDSISGIEPTLCETSSNSGNALGTFTLTANCVDRLENLGNASYTLKIDPFAPSIRGTGSPAPNGFGWNNSAVTVSFTCDDGGLSGVASNTLAGATLSSEGANQSVTNTGACTDNAGNVSSILSTVSSINIDLTKPTISAAATTAPNGNGWYNSAVTVHFTCADALSGVIPLTCPADQILSSEGAAVSSTARTISDRAANISDPSNVVTVKFDKTAPVVTVTGVSNGATYTAGSVPAAACSTSDALAGVATPATLSLTGGSSNGSGLFTATCSGATDVAGNNTPPTSVSYTVNAQINSSVSPQSVSAVYTTTPQSCPSTGGSLPIHTITPTLRNTTSTSFSGLFFRVKTIEYTSTQSGQPVLCNVSSGNGGVGSTLTIPNSSLPGGNSQFNPGEDLVPTFQVGLPVRAPFRFFVELYAVGVAAATDDATQAGEYLGSFAYTFDTPPANSGVTQLFLPLITR